MVALAVPPPSQMARSPKRTRRRRISHRSVAASFAPVAPKGCPSAIAPPFTFRRDGSAPMAFAHAMGTLANASFTSYKPISPMVSPARSSAFWVAGMGPVSIATGSAAATATSRTRASGVSPYFLSAASLTTSIAAAPSAICDADPAVSLPPCAGERGLSFASDASVVPGRTHSSALRSDGTSTSSSAKAPRACARAARAWLCAANESSSSRVSGP
mmetsp:Transcript_30938/g.100755  ORF Transcript_30938/g.100755 Transcript_30938/m.100755 type:complete len:216 (+) Transcript_30938:130-777(+)